jgi:hypothetical protein
MTPSLRLVLAVILLAGPILGAAFAETFVPYDEIKKRSQIFESKPSFDTAPVVVQIVDVTYRIPRNYLSKLPPAIPAVKVTFPGFRPLTEETRDCFDAKWQHQNPGICTAFEFLLLGSRGPAPGGRAYTAAERLENFKKNIPGGVQRRGPYGYDIYEIGPEEARIQRYRKIEGDILLTCFGNDDGTGSGVCDDTFRLDDGNHAHFIFFSSSDRTRA